MSTCGEKAASQKLRGVRGPGQSGKKILNNPQTHGTDFERIHCWLEDPPAKHVVLFALKAAQIRVVKKTEIPEESQDREGRAKREALQ